MILTQWQMLVNVAVSGCCLSMTVAMFFVLISHLGRVQEKRQVKYITVTRRLDDDH